MIRPFSERFRCSHVRIIKRENGRTGARGAVRTCYSRNKTLVTTTRTYAIVDTSKIKLIMLIFVLIEQRFSHTTHESTRPVLLSGTASGGALRQNVIARTDQRTWAVPTRPSCAQASEVALLIVLSRLIQAISHVPLSNQHHVKLSPSSNQEHAQTALLQMSSFLAKRTQCLELQLGTWILRSLCDVCRCRSPLLFGSKWLGFQSLDRITYSGPPSAPSAAP